MGCAMLVVGGVNKRDEGGVGVRQNKRRRRRRD